MRYTVTTFKVRLEVAESGIRLKDSKDAEIIARGIFNRLDADKEHFVVMGTNNKNQINGYKEVSTGTLTSSLVSPGEVFLAALRLRAAAIICVHNHPAGDPMPSQEDQDPKGRNWPSSGSTMILVLTARWSVGTKRKMRKPETMRFAVRRKCR